MKKFTVKPKTFLTREVIVGLQDEKSYPDKILIGKLAEAGGIVSVFHEVTSEHVLAIFGKRGSGKSYTLGDMVEDFVLKIEKIPYQQFQKRKRFFYLTHWVFINGWVFHLENLPIQKPLSHKYPYKRNGTWNMNHWIY